MCKIDNIAQKFEWSEAIEVNKVKTYNFFIKTTQIINNNNNNNNYNLN